MRRCVLTVDAAPQRSDRLQVMDGSNVCGRAFEKRVHPRAERTARPCCTCTLEDSSTTLELRGDTQSISVNQTHESESRDTSVVTQKGQRAKQLDGQRTTCDLRRLCRGAFLDARIACACKAVLPPQCGVDTTRLNLIISCTTLGRDFCTCTHYGAVRLEPRLSLSFSQSHVTRPSSEHSTHMTRQKGRNETASSSKIEHGWLCILVLTPRLQGLKPILGSVPHIHALVVRRRHHRGRHLRRRCRRDHGRRGAGRRGASRRGAGRRGAGRCGARDVESAHHTLEVGSERAHVPECRTYSAHATVRRGHRSLVAESACTV
jgi:hypothetical protein